MRRFAAGGNTKMLPLVKEWTHAAKADLERQAEIDVGYDFLFERRWGRFERGMWLFFVLLMVAGVTGLLGRGPLNHVKKTAEDGTTIQYEAAGMEWKLGVNAEGQSLESISAPLASAS